jgi:hypothetical protein
MGLFRKLIDSIAGTPGKPANAAIPPVRVTANQQHKPRPSTNPRKVDLAGFPTSPIQADPPSTLTPKCPDALPTKPDSILDEMIDALDTNFDKACLQAPGNESGHAELHVDEEASIQELFAEITAAYVVPLKNFVFELHRHTATRDSIALCRSVLHSVRSAAESIKLPEAVRRMDELDQCLIEGQTGSSRFLEGDIREQILSKYNSLAEVLPASFRIGDEGRKREDIIIQSLLQQISGVGCVTLEKLYQSGLGSLHMLLMGNPEDLAAATALRRPLCEKICLKMKQYRADCESWASQPGQLGYRSHLVEIIDALRKLSDGDGRGQSLRPIDSSGVAKRERRKQQTRLLLEVKVILAELGQLELIRKLERVSLQRRIDLLDEHLAQWKV